ncbi:hypothetical protein [Actinopolyspora mortivallis]|uniref:Helix-turn-helix domain-containing protein n=1 Tax=Actinopolyspora mortivallis TaxID=33906 RepID=A0A2T0GRV5_ACTMO|nr:hypothetical protein [Actinopolyspora mortivallis]PRW61848.1 hypothetical protein CEP50_18605 [Actinopolyspora mortivallis]
MAAPYFIEPDTIVASIASLLGVSRSTVYEYVSEFGTDLATSPVADHDRRCRTKGPFARPLSVRSRPGAHNPMAQRGILFECNSAPELSAVDQHIPPFG